MGCPSNDVNCFLQMVHLCLVVDACCLRGAPPPEKGDGAMKDPYNGGNDVMWPPMNGFCVAPPPNLPGDVGCGGRESRI